METFDLARMFVGDLSLSFAFEIVLRTTILYVYALALLRMFGRRASQNMTTFEFVIVIALGSAVGDPMFYPDVPILSGVIVITVVMALEHGIAFLVRHFHKVDLVVSGTPHLLIVDGRLNRTELRNNVLATSELFAELRSQGVAQLGEVKCAYLEEGGSISVLRYADSQVRPGLPIVPPWDLRPPPTYRMPDPVPHAGVFACCDCGQRLDYADAEPLLLCPTCANPTWTDAVVEIDAPARTDIVR
jgi:uncharacterized membrane protein YcaP (DUF421 family)